VWGIAWWVGSLLLGVLYDRNRMAAGATAAAALVAGALIVALSGRARAVRADAPPRA